MRWKFWKKNDLLSNFDPHLAASIAFYRMAQEQSPFNHWRPDDVEIPAHAEAFVEVCVWAYQLSVYLDCIERKFGSDTATLVKTHLVALLGRADPEGTIPRYIEIISKGRGLPLREKFFAHRPELQVDCNVAKALLVTTTETEESRSQLYPILGNALTLGRASAEACFSNFVDFMEFRPDTITNMRKPDEIRIQWSDSPGCFECHLKRRHMNPLFPKLRRRVTESDLVQARGRDLADLKELEHKVTGVLIEISELEDQTTIGNCVRILEKIEALLIRTAEVGEMANAQKTLLSKYHSQLLKCAKSGWLTEEQSAFEELLSQSRHYLEVRGRDFFAQMTREDTPIAEDEMLPSLLSESLETVHLYVRELCEKDPLKMNELHQQASGLISSAQQEGYYKTEWREKLEALSCLGRSSGK